MPRKVLPKKNIKVEKSGNPLIKHFGANIRFEKSMGEGELAGKIIKFIKIHPDHSPQEVINFLMVNSNLGSINNIRPINVVKKAKNGKN